MSKQRFEAMTPADREIVLDAAARSVPVMRENWAKFSEESRLKAMKQGITANDADREAFRASVADLVKSETQDPVLASLYTRVRNLSG